VLAHNVPATTADQHPNWRRRVRYAVEDWGRVQAVEELLQVVAHGRRTAG
jgi:4-alpha-glucanotransferase